MTWGAGEHGPKLKQTFALAAYDTGAGASGMKTNNNKKLYNLVAGSTVDW